MMNVMEYSPYMFDDCPSIISDCTENEIRIDERVKKAETIDDLVSLFSDDLVQSIKDQLHLK